MHIYDDKVSTIENSLNFITPAPWEVKEHDVIMGKNLVGRWRITAKAREEETRTLFVDCFSDLVAVLPIFSGANAFFIANSPLWIKLLLEKNKQLSENIEKLSRIIIQNNLKTQ